MIYCFDCINPIRIILIDANSQLEAEFKLINNHNIDKDDFKFNCKSDKLEISLDSFRIPINEMLVNLISPN